MFTDARTSTRIAPLVRRVVIVDANAHTSRLLADLMKGFGAHTIVCETSEPRGLAAIKELEPGVIFTEFSGVDFDGVRFARSVRRSHFAGRKAPIIMVTAEATLNSIRRARDAGVHEFLKKPFTSADLLRRVENVATKPRPWIEGVDYVGPDRRRFNSGEYVGPAKRQSDRPVNENHQSVDDIEQAVRILAAALDQYDSDPEQADRAIHEQAKVLKHVCLQKSDTRLAAAVGALEVSLASGARGKVALSAPIQTILALHPTDKLKESA